MTSGTTTTASPRTIPTLHIGKMIEAELRRQKRTVTWFGRQLHCDRRNIYDIFRRASIDTDLLARISLILGHNFFKTMSDMIDGTTSQIRGRQEADMQREEIPLKIAIYDNTINHTSNTKRQLSREMCEIKHHTSAI